MSDTSDRETRLAEALRANLRRRKAQARHAPNDAAAPEASPAAPAPAEPGAA